MNVYIVQFDTRPNDFTAPSAQRNTCDVYTSRAAALNATHKEMLAYYNRWFSSSDADTFRIERHENGTVLVNKFNEHIATCWLMRRELIESPLELLAECAE